MPKIIDDLKTTILAETKKQVFEKGYKNFTIRSVALACGIATGTIYNYYSSKKALVAALVLEDWIPVYERMERDCKGCDDKLHICSVIYEGLLAFQKEYRPLFAQDAAIESASTAMPGRHPMLRHKLAELIYGTKELELSDFTAEFLSEALLAWSSDGRSFSDLEPIIKRIVHQEVSI